MKKQTFTTILAALLLIIWGLVTIGLLVCLFVELSFWQKLALFALSLVFFMLFSFYNGRLWLAFQSESQRMSRLNNELEAAIIATENIQKKKQAKEALLSRFLEEMEEKGKSDI